MYEGNPSRKRWLQAMHPFGGYTAHKQREYLAAWDRAEKAKHAMEPQTCKDCKREIAQYADFPGPRCLDCHAKRFENTPPQAPDFTRVFTSTKREKR